MPPKSSKKPSKPSPSRSLSSSSDRSSPSAAARREQQGPVNDEHLSRSLLDQASLKYPSLISPSSFIGQITAVDSNPSGHAATLWLSEAAMVTSSLFPGSLVSVSLATSSKKETTGDSPLESLEEECARHFGLDIGDNVVVTVGSFFAFAVVFPSCKVLKNGVKLSWSLSCTMGGPDMGRTIFISPIQNQSVDNPTNDGNEHFENDQVSSPKTPSPYQSRLSSQGASQMRLRRGDNSILTVNHQSNVMSLDVSSITKALEDEKAKQLLEISAAWWLSARCLLRGNVVAIPIGPQIGFFRVDGADTLLVKWFKQDSTYERKCSLMPPEISSPCLVNHVDAAFLVESKAKVHLFSSMPSSMETPAKGDLSLLEDEERFGISKLGGLSKEFAELKQIIFDKIQHHANYTGVLLHGPPGTGKTSLACSCAHDSGVKLLSVNGPEIVSEVYGKSEKELHQVFDKAKQAASAMVFIDELDAIAPARHSGSEQLSQRMVVTLLKLMDEIKTTSVLVVAATNRPDSIDPALRRHGRFDREIEIGVPSREQRLDILLTLLSEINHSLVDTEIQSLASSTHGFVGADLAALCNKAALITLRRYNKLKCSYDLPSLNQQRLMPDHVDSMTCLLSDLTISSEEECAFGCDDKAPKSDNSLQASVLLSNDDRSCILNQEHLLKVTFDDFEKARMEVRPSAMREVMVEVPKVSWEDIGGQDEVKKQLIEAVQWPQKHQSAFKRVGIRPPTGVLMFGPPGCSKTLMARAVASNAGLNFLAVKGPELFSKWVGESEKAVRSLFNKARAAAPSIIFFDEFDGLATTRGQENDGVSVADRVMTQLLVELDGLKQRVDVTVIAATNRPDKIDPALLRPGRFDRLLYVGPPNQADREDIFRINMRRMPFGSDVNVGALSHLTNGFTGADITSICREAALVALEENIDISEVSMRHFEVSIGRVQPSDVQSYGEFSTKFQRLVCSDNSKMR
ncbi:hypothetical protein AAC387_Pa04g2383 [Persea americana]